MEYEVIKFKNDKFEMSYLKFGAGKRVMIILPGVCLRPICTSPEAVVDAYKMFSDDYTVYLFDRKENMDEAYTPEDMANDTIEVIKSLGLRNLNILGVSHGGIIAQYIAIKESDLVKKLFIASSTYYMNDLGAEFYSKIIDYCRVKDARSLTNYMCRKMYSKEFNDEYKDSIINMYADMSDYELSQVEHTCTGYNSVYTLMDLPKIKAKTMIAVSKNDEVFGYEPSLLMTYKLGCECVFYDEYTHTIYDDAPDFKERLLNFFNGK